MAFHPSTLVFYRHFKGTIIYPSAKIGNPRLVYIIDSVVCSGCVVVAFPFGNEKSQIAINKSYLGPRGYFSSNGGLSIENASFAPNVFVGTFCHSITKSQPDSHYSIVIDSPKLIGQNSSIFGNVRVAPGAVIGACSVVVNDVPENSMVVGNPAKIIKTYVPENDEWIPIH